MAVPNLQDMFDAYKHTGAQQNVGLLADLKSECRVLRQQLGEIEKTIKAMEILSVQLPSTGWREANLAEQHRCCIGLRASIWEFEQMIALMERRPAGMVEGAK